jgi:hypothetical protein
MGSRRRTVDRSVDVGAEQSSSNFCESVMRCRGAVPGGVRGHCAGDIEDWFSRHWAVAGGITRGFAPFTDFLKDLGVLSAEFIEVCAGDMELNLANIGPWGASFS